jgi:2-amino-4-hydroxy-6-hydroxymethyldihydropteridine diphosphokinase
MFSTSAISNRLSGCGDPKQGGLIVRRWCADERLPVSTDSGTFSGEAGIGMGSNLGPSLHMLQSAWKCLQEHPEIHPLAISSPYRSRPVNMASANWFVNAVALVRTTLSPGALLHTLQTIEEDFGRTRRTSASGYQDRTLDLDLLFYDDRIMHTEALTLPHPRMGERLFVLEPLVEIAGDRILPPANEPVRTLLKKFRHGVANQEVEKILWPGTSGSIGCSL